MGYPFPVGASTYFRYTAISGMFNAAGLGFLNGLDGTPAPSSVESETLSGFAFTTGRCDPVQGLSTFGVSAAPNLHFSYIAAGANFNTANVTCTYISEMLTTRNGDFQVRGPIMVDIGH